MYVFSLLFHSSCVDTQKESALQTSLPLESKAFVFSELMVNPSAIPLISSAKLLLFPRSRKFFCNFFSLSS